MPVGERVARLRLRGLSLDTARREVRLGPAAPHSWALQAVWPAASSLLLCVLQMCCASLMLCMQAPCACMHACMELPQTMPTCARGLCTVRQGAAGNEHAGVRRTSSWPDTRATRWRSRCSAGE